VTDLAPRRSVQAVLDDPAVSGAEVGLQLLVVKMSANA
jgi:hypothetical protein